MVEREPFDSSAELLASTAERLEADAERLEADAERLEADAERTDAAAERLQAAAKRLDVAAELLDAAAERLHAASARLHAAAERLAFNECIMEMMAAMQRIFFSDCDPEIEDFWTIDYILLQKDPHVPAIATIIQRRLSFEIHHNSIDINLSVKWKSEKPPGRYKFLPVLVSEQANNMCSSIKWTKVKVFPVTGYYNYGIIATRSLPSYDVAKLANYIAAKIGQKLSHCCIFPCEKIRFNDFLISGVRSRIPVEAYGGQTSEDSRKIIEVKVPTVSSTEQLWMLSDSSIYCWPQTEDKFKNGSFQLEAGVQVRCKASKPGTMPNRCVDQIMDTCRVKLICIEFGVVWSRRSFFHVLSDHANAKDIRSGRVIICECVDESLAERPDERTRLNQLFNEWLVDHVSSKGKLIRLVTRSKDDDPEFDYFVITLHEERMDKKHSFYSPIVSLQSYIDSIQS